MGLKVDLRPDSPFYYVRGTVAGKRVRESTGARDKETAEQIKTQIEARLHREALYGPEAEYTFADACNGYFDAKGDDQRGYLRSIIEKIGRLKLIKVTPALVKSLARELYPDLKPQTWNRYVVIPASAVVNHAHQSGMCPPIRIQRFAARDSMIRVPVDRAWIDRFRAHATTPRLAAYALFMFTTAARPTEAIELTPAHLDLDNLTGKSEVTKTGEPRIFYLTEEMAQELRALPPRKLQWGKNAGELRVFGWADCKGPIEPWKESCRRAGLTYRSPYEAGRHSFATEAVTRQERNVVEAAKVGNWKDPNVLVRNYAHAEHPARFAEEVFGAKPVPKKRIRAVK